MKRFFICLLFCFANSVGFSQTKISVQETANHTGDTVMLIDKVYSNKVLENGINLLDLGGKFPNQLLTLTISAKVVSSFAYNPAKYLQGKQILVTGKVVDNQGKHVIEITDPSQIQELRFNDPKIDLKGF